MSDYTKLQNGSDIRGIALPGVPGEEVNLTPEAVRELASAFTLWLSERTGRAPSALRVGVGSDSRLSAAELSAAAREGIRACGAAVYDCGMASTPAMFMSTVLAESRFDGSVMLTASHLPWNRNGMKFFSPEGGLEKGDIAAIIKTAAALPAPAGQPGAEHSFDMIAPYSAHLRRVITEGAGRGEKPLAGFRIAVDAGNGAGGFFAAQVLAPLGADISASRYLEPDGRFPNHVPNPEDHAAMEAIRAAVLEGGCDLGVIFDTDVDRAGAVDSSGDELCRNRLIGLMAAICARSCPGCTIVTDSVTSDQLADFINNRLGCRHHRFQRGYRNVINEAKRLEAEGIAAPLAMETSGHAALSENYYLDDGAYLCCKLIVELARLRAQGRELSSLLEGLGEPLEAAEYRPRILREDFRAYGNEVLGRLAEYAKGKPGWIPAPDNHEGLRFSLPQYGGWFLLRLSLHDPLMPLNIESTQKGGAAAILAELAPFLDGCEGLSRI